MFYAGYEIKGVKSTSVVCQRKASSKLNIWTVVMEFSLNGTGIP